MGYYFSLLYTPLHPSSEYPQLTQLNLILVVGVYHYYAEYFLGEVNRSARLHTEQHCRTLRCLLYSGPTIPSIKLRLSVVRPLSVVA